MTPWWHGVILVVAGAFCIAVTTPRPGMEYTQRIGLGCAMIAGAWIIIEDARRRWPRYCKKCRQRLTEDNTYGTHPGVCCKCVDYYGLEGH